MQATDLGSPLTAPVTAPDTVSGTAPDSAPGTGLDGLGGPDAAPADRPPLRSLSPSRAADFKACPLLFRFRTIDRLPEPPSPAAVRGTVVHAVLEKLFDLPPAERTLAASQRLVDPVWRELAAAEPELAGVFAAPPPPSAPPPSPPLPGADAGAAAGTDTAMAADAAAPEDAWLESARQLLVTYFRLEDPTRLEPAAREERVEVETSGLRLRGIIDRLDVSPAGDVRIVDYKTGASPREAFEAKALFQMKFYALVVWRTRGVVPRVLQLLYLADGDSLTYRPDAAELERFERTLAALGEAVGRAVEQADFRPNPGRLCDWCAHRALCPAFGGTPPPFPVGVQPAEPEFGGVAVPAG